ncbi:MULTISPECIES: hypothetical protein [unclassified Streptomyces]|uniref:hypothetical protein n=1 Tax=unclassified Streptomyces TaxID=2593676 RepID=UPI000B50C028|nr:MULTISPECIES: hypothetical protein [unclassified Streptomyces]MYW99941.1 hypothetical protein [Streptomyces sp. SID8378]SNB89910.1 hypothetical protein SAMN02745831_06204 [Streptomyces sp. PgraA7]
MSAPRYRELAERVLDRASQQLSAMPQGTVSAAEIQARAAQAQAYATVAVAQALLEIGDVLRERLTPPGGAD